MPSRGDRETPSSRASGKRGPRPNPLTRDVDPAALHEVARETIRDPTSLEIGIAGECGSSKREKAVEGVLVAGMRRRGQEDHVAGPDRRASR